MFIKYFLHSSTNQFLYSLEPTRRRTFPAEQSIQSFCIDLPISLRTIEESLKLFCVQRTGCIYFCVFL